MGTFSIWHWLVVLVVVLVLFGGGGKISRLMGDFGTGLKSFKKSMKEDDEVASDTTADRKAIDDTDGKASAPAAAAEKDKAAG